MSGRTCVRASTSTYSNPLVLVRTQTHELWSCVRVRLCAYVKFIRRGNARAALISKRNLNAYHAPPWVPPEDYHNRAIIDTSFRSTSNPLPFLSTLSRKRTRDKKREREIVLLWFTDLNLDATQTRKFIRSNSSQSFILELEFQDRTFVVSFYSYISSSRRLTLQTNRSARLLGMDDVERGMLGISRLVC